MGHSRRIGHTKHTARAAGVGWGIVSEQYGDGRTIARSSHRGATVWEKVVVSGIRVEYVVSLELAIVLKSDLREDLSHTKVSI